MVRPPKCGSIADGLGLTITIFQPFISASEPQRSRNLERAERKFDVMQALGTDEGRTAANSFIATANRFSTAAKANQRADDRAKRAGCTNPASERATCRPPNQREGRVDRREIVRDHLNLGLKRMPRLRRRGIRYSDVGANFFARL